MGDVTPREIFDIKRISAFKNRKINKVKKLEPVGGIGRYIKRNNIVILIIFFEFDRIMAFVIIKDKKALSSFCTSYSMLIEMFDPF